MKKKQNVSPTQRALNVWAIILIIWALYRAQVQTSLPLWIDEFIAKPAVFIFPVFYFIHRIEKKDFLSEIGIKGTLRRVDIYILGVLTVLYGIGMVLMRKQSGLAPLSTSSFLYIFSLSLATGFSEQILSTGFILNRLYRESRNMFTAPFFASILFFFLHIPILFTDERIVGYALLNVMLTDVLLSLSISYMFIARRSLLYPIMIHAFYNMSIFILIF